MEQEVFQLSEICEIKSGKRIPKDMSFVEVPTNHPYIRARDIKDGRINIDSLIYLEDNVYEKIKKYIIRSNDIAITIVGASVGDIAYAQQNVDRYNLTENAVRLTNFNNKVHSKYLFYMLYQKQYKDYMQLIAGAAAQPKLGIYKIQKIKVKLPNQLKQIEIASILSTYDDLIEKNNRKIEILQEMAEELYKEWFVRFRFPGYKTAKFIDGIPEGWKETKLGNICKITTGNKDANEATGDGLYPFFTCARETTLTTNEYILDTDAILVSGNGSYTGLVKKFSGKFDLYQRTYALYDFNDVDWLYIYWVMKTDFEPKHMGGTNGAAIPYITKPVLQKYKLLVPNKDLLNEAGKIFAYCHKQCNLLEKQNNNLKQQRDLLLPRLMSGKLEVKVS